MSKVLAVYPSRSNPSRHFTVMSDAFHPSLRLHPLSGKFAGLHSVSINLSYRITLELLIEG